MGTIYLPSEVTAGPHGYDDPGNFTGTAPYLNTADGYTSYVQGQVFQEYRALYLDVPAGQIMLHVQARSDGNGYVYVGTHADFDAGEGNVTEVPLTEGDGTMTMLAGTHMTSVMHSGGDLELFFDLGGYGLWTVDMSYMGVEIVDGTTGGRLKVLTPMGWEWAIPGIGENDGRLMLRTSSGWLALAPGDLQIQTPDGWLPVS